jgi:hypothetical protein
MVGPWGIIINLKGVRGGSKMSNVVESMETELFS